VLVFDRLALGVAQIGQSDRARAATRVGVR